MQKGKSFWKLKFRAFKNFLFLHFMSQWLANQSQAYLWNMQMHKADFHESSLSREPLTKDLRNSLPKIFKKLKFLKNFTTRDHSRKQSRNGQTQFFNTKNLTFWEKLSRPKWQKSLLETNKILKNLFGFDHQAIEHTHITFEHVQSHKWNRYSLNIRLVCCVYQVWISP